jgi:CheY-like chemotaxis protein
LITSRLAPTISRSPARVVGGAANGSDAPDGPDPTPAGTDVDDHRLKDITVLVVDDDFRNIFAMTALLERLDATVVTAESGPVALVMLERNRDIDLVLMDIMMPGMDGYKTIGAIRAQDHLRTIPVVAVTGKVVVGERQRCLDAGANGYVPKPVNTAALLNAIAPWIPQAEPAS